MSFHSPVKRQFRVLEGYYVNRQKTYSLSYFVSQYPEGCARCVPHVVIPSFV